MSNSETQGAEKTDGAINNEQFRDTGSIVH